MCLKINWSVKRRDIGLVWEQLPPGYGLLVVFVSQTAVCAEGKRFASSKAKTDYRAVERTCFWFFWFLRYRRLTGGLFIVVVRMAYSSPESPGVEEDLG